MLHLLPKFHSRPDPQGAVTRPAIITAIEHLHIRLPEPGPSYPPHEASYFEAGEMSRLMEHL
jgi:hypothetical protein